MGVFDRDGNGPSPEEREERIARLRKRRHARLRWLAVRAVLAAGALVLLLTVAGGWLLATIGGREFLMAQVVARLPAGAALKWQRIEGDAAGPLVLHGVHFELPRQRDPDCVPTATASCAMGTIVFDAERVMLDPALAPLLGRELRLDALQVSDAVLRLPRSDTPFELPRWPESLPGIAPPLAVTVPDVRVDDLRVLGETDTDGEYRSTIAIERLRGGLRAGTGELHIDRLQVVSDRGRFGVDGDYLPGDNYRTDLVATAVWPDGDGRLGVVARGDLDAMHVGVAGAAPGAVRATLSLRGGERPQWRLAADAEALDPALLTGASADARATPLAFELRAEGVGGRARVRGGFSRGGLAATVLPSRLLLEEQVLQLDPLALQVYDGRVVARGRADFREPGAPEFRFAINARGLEWGGATTDAPLIGADASLGLAGTLQAWAAIGKAALTRGDTSAQIGFDARGDAERLRLRTLRARMPTGTLDATGTVAWAPTLGWDIEAQLAGFDPGYFVAGWDGAVDGELASTGRSRDDGGLEAAVEVADLGGRLRGRALDGHGRFAMHGAAGRDAIARYEGEVELSLGDSHVAAEGTVGATLDIDARFAPLQLADLLPDAGGTLRGTLAMDGARTGPDIRADLQGNDLRFGRYAAQSVSVQGELPWSDGDGALAVRAGGLDAGIALDSLAIDARGAVESLQLDAQTQGPAGALALAGEVERRGSTWQGTLASLRLAPAKGARWQLQDPARFGWNAAAGRGTLSSTCLASSVGGSLCVAADWPQRGLSVEGQGLPLALVRPYLPEPEPGRDWLLRGEVAIDAQLRPLGNAWQGHANVSSESGGLRFSDRSRRELIRYDDLQLRANLQRQGVDAQLSATLNDDGRLQAGLMTGWHSTAPLNGELTLDIDELTWLELFSPDIVAPSGQLAGRVTIGGTREEPRIGGQAQLSGFSTEIPSLAIALHEGNARLTAQPDGRARISGSVRTAATGAGEGAAGGVLNLDGTLGWRGQDVPVVLTVSGERVLVSDTRDLHAVVSPDITVRVPAEQPIAVTGTVVVPEARLDLERLDRGVSPSPDVVVLDPVDPEDDGTATAVVVDLTLVLGEDVVLDGFGLDASLDGRLSVHSEPGREMTAVGNLDVDGEYSAYGQELEITRGRLSWSGGPIGDPVLDLRARREIGEVTAGVTISGRASAPQAEVWTDPASSQSEALAWLTLGRPLSSLTGDERNQVSAASAALTAGGSLLAGQIGARLGLDEAGVMQTRTAGSIFGIGKQISPRLYVGYGVSLLGTGTVLTLKYLLDHGFDIEVESSRVENRASLNWRKEK